MKKNIKALNATDFYKYLTCPHWPWFELYATVAEKKTKRSLTQGEIRRLDDGYLHEKVVMTMQDPTSHLKSSAQNLFVVSIHFACSFISPTSPKRRGLLFQICL